MGISGGAAPAARQARLGGGGGAVGAAEALPEVRAWVEWGWVQWRPVRHALDMRSRASKRRSVTWVWDALLPDLGLELGS